VSLNRQCVLNMIKQTEPIQSVHPLYYFRTILDSSREIEIEQYSFQNHINGD